MRSRRVKRRRCANTFWPVKPCWPRRRMWPRRSRLRRCSGWRRGRWRKVGRRAMRCWRRSISNIRSSWRLPIRASVISRKSTFGSTGVSISRRGRRPGYWRSSTAATRPSSKCQSAKAVWWCSPRVGTRRIANWRCRRSLCRCFTLCLSGAEPWPRRVRRRPLRKTWRFRPDRTKPWS